MKNQLNKFFAVIILLLFVGVGNMWGGTKRIYCEYSGVSSWWSTIYVYAWGGGHEAKKYTMTATGTTNLVRCDIDDYHTDLLFYKSSTQGGSWETQSVDVSISSNNRWSLGDGGYGNKATISNQQRYAPGTAIDGLVDIKNPHNQMFTDGEYSVTLEAHKTYEFKILETSTLYGLNDLIATSSISNQTLNTSGYQVRLCTAGAGTYTFRYNTTNHQLSITYPETLHPSIDYCYVINYSWDPSANLHFWDGTSTKVAEWNDKSTIQGSAWPGAALSVTDTIIRSGQSYFYIAPGEFDYFMVSKNGDGTDRTGEVQPSDGYGKYRSWASEDGWQWRNFTVRIQLNDLSATTHVVPTYQDVAFNSDVLTDLTTVPQKTHYDFGGFYTEHDDVNDVATGTQVIDANGQWIASVADYTDASKHWIHSGTETTLYAMWTEHEYDLTIDISPAGAGSVSPSPTKVKLVTPTDLLTATPANGAWKFKEWQYSTNLGPYGGTGNDNTVRVTASQNGTLTAVFEPRFTLVGSICDDSGNGGMPGWNDYTAEFEVTNSPFSATCTRKLDPNTTFKFEVHDKTGYGRNLGHSPAGQCIGNNSWECNTPNSDIYLRATGHGDYTFTISAVREDNGNYYPTISVSGPSSHLMNLGWGHAEIDNPSSVTDGENTGGTVSAQTTESGDHYAIVNGQYVADGGTITYTPNAATGYSFDGWYSSNAYSGDPFSRNNPWAHENVTSDDNVYAKFTEKSTSVSLANDGHGHVTIGGTTVANTTCGVTTHRELTAVPSDGYMFSSWTKTSGNDITISSTSTNPITLTGNGDGASSGQTVTANFTQRWVLKAESEGWGSETFTISNISEVSGDAVGYVDIDLAANTNYQFTMKDLSNNNIYKNNDVAVQYMTYTNHTDWGFATDKTYNCGITTAGRGTYRFSWNITDKTMTVTYPESYQVNYGASLGGSVTSVIDDDNNAVPNGGYVRRGGNVTYTATANNANYTFAGWCNNDSYGNPFTDFNPWTNSNIVATSNAYAKFKSTNFVIYRTGDMSSDPRAVYDDVESYAGGTITETIEFRMKVHRLDYWYSLCLPFTVNAVQVWDEDDNAYYDLVPYYRVGDNYYNGHYIIRTPSPQQSMPIEGFEGRDHWTDPANNSYKPEKNKPYIIQWHQNYFSGRYVSFFGEANQTIPTAMSAGSTPTSDNVVDINVNNAMISSSVAGAYLLEADYGPNGAWLRGENPNDSRTVLPFECYILANSATRARYKVLRPDMEIVEDVTTGLDTLNYPTDKATKVIINNQLYIIRGGKMYTIQGAVVK